MISLIFSYILIKITNHNKIFIFKEQRYILIQYQLMNTMILSFEIILIYTLEPLEQLY